MNTNPELGPNELRLEATEQDISLAAGTLLDRIFFLTRKHRTGRPDTRDSFLHMGSDLESSILIGKHVVDIELDAYPEQAVTDPAVRSTFKVRDKDVLKLASAEATFAEPYDDPNGDDSSLTFTIVSPDSDTYLVQASALIGCDPTAQSAELDSKNPEDIGTLALLLAQANDVFSSLLT